MTSAAPTRPVTASDPAWFFAGDPRCADYGSVFLKVDYKGTHFYSFDRAGFDFACWMTKDAPQVGESLQVQGRLFLVKAEQSVRKAA